MTCEGKVVESSDVQHVRLVINRITSAAANNRLCVLQRTINRLRVIRAVANGPVGPAMAGTIIESVIKKKN